MPDVTGERAQLAIARAVVEGGKLVARVGETEGRAAAWRLANRLGSSAPKTYEALNRERLKLLAGYFPTTDEGIDRLADLYIKAIARIDIYAAWTPHDKLLLPRSARTCRLVDIEPFFSDARWTRALAGQRVTIVSPFKRTIDAQWKLRDKLFTVETMPDCDLCVVQAPQTQCEADTAGMDWFQNLARLNAMVADTRPDTVIIGAGAYGLPVGLAAVNAGASAVVMGGSTQLLFGIMGNRWSIHPKFQALENQYWTRPGVDERPPGFENFETAGGAYW